MSQEQTIQPLNVAAATLFIQVLLLIMMGITTSLIKRPRSTSEDHVREAKQALFGAPKSGAILFIALLTLGVLLDSDDFYSVWRPVFQGIDIFTMSAETAINSVFVADLVLVGYLMFVTGGSRDSPFIPVLFTVPALAIFLRVSPGAFVSFAILAAALYLILLVETLRQPPSSMKATAFMSIACLAISMFTGYITRPIPIDQLAKRDFIGAHETTQPATK